MVQSAIERDGFPLECVDLRDVGEGSISGMMSALQFQHRLFVREMGGILLPPQIPQDSVQVAMDFICGPGNWCLDFSQRHPEAKVYGVDIQRQIITMARENAAQVQSSKLEWRYVERKVPLPFPDATFDLIRIQNGTSLFSLHQWPVIMEEMARLLKPGGWLNLIDFEMGPTSHSALDRVLTFLAQILAKMGRSISPSGLALLNGCTLGPSRMTQLGFTEIGYRLYPVNLGGWNNPVGRAYLAWSVVRPEMILYLAGEVGVSSVEELQPLLREMQRELQQLGFCGVGMLLSSFGRKPLSET